MSLINTNQKVFNQELLEFLSASPTPFHAVANMITQLKRNGFEQLNEGESWNLKPKGRYYVTRNESSIIAFINGNYDQGVRMIGAHTDFPCLKIKPIPELYKKQYFQLATEVYGGVLLNPWFDRDLSIAGRVTYLNDNDEIHASLIDFKKAIAVIPSLAIHLDREANKNRSVNPQTDVQPILCQLSKDEKINFRSLLEQQLVFQGIGKTNIKELLEFDLSLYDVNRAKMIGLNDEFIVSSSLDNLLSCFVGMKSMITSADYSGAVSLLVCNDHEECGSTSAIGADGSMLKDTLQRVVGVEKMPEVMSKSMLISTDNAHGVHPNYSDRHEGNHQPLLNHGVVLKLNSNQRYASNDETCAIFRLLCKEVGAFYQYFVTRSDLGCGSTIGPITASQLGVRTLDVGLPTFSMHSIRETAGVKDAAELCQILAQFYKKNDLFTYSAI